MDNSAAALQQARAGLPRNAELQAESEPADLPPVRFDLVRALRSGYHLDEKDCHQLASLAMNTARDLVAVHWRHRVEDHPLTGDQVHPVIQQAATNHGLERICNHIEADFRLAVRSRDQPSVASRAG